MVMALGASTVVALDHDRIGKLAERERALLDRRTPGPARCSAGRAGFFQGAWCPPSSRAGPGRSTWRAARGRASGTWTATSTSTCTTASAPWSRARPPRRRRGRRGALFRGTHFAAATEDAVVVAEELARRWASALAFRQLGHRGDNGGHTDRPRAHGPRRRAHDRRQLPRPPRRGDGGRKRGVPRAVARDVHSIDFNDAAAMSGRSFSPAKGASRPACSWSP